MKIIYVNADGTSTLKEFESDGASLELRSVDYNAGKVWQRVAAASDGEQSAEVYVEIPWASFSRRTPQQELEAQRQYRRQQPGGLPK